MKVATIAIGLVLAWTLTSNSFGQENTAQEIAEMKATIAELKAELQSLRPDREAIPPAPAEPLPAPHSLEYVAPPLETNPQSTQLPPPEAVPAPRDPVVVAPEYPYYSFPPNAPLLLAPRPVVVVEQPACPYGYPIGGPSPGVYVGPGGWGFSVGGLQFDFPTSQFYGHPGRGHHYGHPGHGHKKHKKHKHD